MSAVTLTVPVDACWLWPWARHVDTGYGLVWVGQGRAGRTLMYAHRYVYTLLVGPIPAGYEIDHLCFVRACVNPAHLEAVTPLENKRRSLARYGNPGVAFQRAKTHCPSGHPLAPGNLRAGPVRRCLTCHRDQARAYRQRLRRGGE